MLAIKEEIEINGPVDRSFACFAAPEAPNGIATAGLLETLAEARISARLPRTDASLGYISVSSEELYYNG